jgi:hypothetical protein
MALVPTLEASENVCIHPHFLDYSILLGILRRVTQVVMDLGEDNMDLPRRRIVFQVYQRGGLQDQERSMSYSDPSEVKRVVTKYVRKGMHLMTMRGAMTRWLAMVPREEAEINKLLIASRRDLWQKMSPNIQTRAEKKNDYREVAYLFCNLNTNSYQH